MSVSITVLGAGSLGSVYAAWAASCGCDVTVIARKPHADAINSNGLTLVTRDGVRRNFAVRALTDAAGVDECDYLCLACKAPDTHELVNDFFRRPRTIRAAFSVQNGVRQGEALFRKIGHRAVACVSMVGGTMLEPGVVAHTFDGATYLGPLQGADLRTATVAADELSSAFPDAGFVVRSDIMSVVWSKAVLAAAAMGMSALTRMYYHRIFELEGNRSAFLNLVEEGARVARAEGIALIDLPGPLQAGHLISLPRDQAHLVLERLAARLVESGQTSVRVSMLQSIDRGRPTEVRAVFRDLLEIGSQHELHLPLLTFVTNVIESIDCDLRGN